jgi:outer membrane protein assembly factor BamB
MGAGSTQKVWTLGQQSRTQPTGSPLTITPVLTSTAPAIWSNGGNQFLFLGMSGNVIKIDITNQTLAETNTNPGSAAVYGRITSASSRVFAGDDAGRMWAIDATNFAGTNRLWQYALSGDSIKSAAYYDYSAAVLHFGTELGKMAAVNANGVALTGYPFMPGSVSDAIRAAPLYLDGILIFGTTTGKLYFYDRNNGTTGPALIKQYYFGPTQMVSSVAYDSSASRYMVTTSDPSAKDGRLYYFDAIIDPTSAK